MRLVCPNCDAQYEIPDEVMPQEGREVQCSSCGVTWFQAHPDFPLTDGAGDAPVAVKPTPKTAPPEPPIKSFVEAPAPKPPEDAPQRRPKELDPEVAEILREEAKWEAEARKRESIPLETQPDLGLDAPTPAEPEPAASAAPVPPKVASAAIPTGPRRDQLPDIDEINSTLRAQQRKDGINGGNRRAARRQKRSAFRRGFAFMLLLASVLVAVYAFAPQIAQAVPQTDPWLSSYVTQVDLGRAWLTDQAMILLRWLDETAAAQESN
ncbi:MAG: zinc-ribbon domain-containing protein [Pseudomonadota bacterium]